MPKNAEVFNKLSKNIKITYVYKTYKKGIKIKKNKINLRRKTMIRVCPYCSNINVDKLKKTVGEENVKTGCIGACRSFSKEAVGKIDGELVIKQTEEEFLELAKKHV